MEVNMPAQSALPSAQQAQTATSSTAQAGATSTLQQIPDNVVTATTNSESANVRDDDAMRRQERNRRDFQIGTLDSLKLDGLKMRVGYEAADETAYLEILTPNTNEILQRISSENLLDFLASRIATSAGLKSADKAGASPVDQSI